MKVLSTKKLSDAQRNRLINAGLHLVMYDAIAIAYVPFEEPKSTDVAIFTSKNGVRGCIAQLEEDYFTSTPSTIVCVGEKTKSLIESFGGNVTKMAQNSKELGDFVVKNYPNAQLSYYCGNWRRDELPNILTSNQVSFSEVIVYQTKLNTQKFEQSWDAVLFFSPSGVDSFVEYNLLKGTLAICIGETTASAAKKYSDHIVVANQTTIDSVVAKTVTTLKKLKI
ncbi:MAG: uroporphyrinogen-III synthase [Marinirhabdus sp.]|nr:uroporphyrinogen-III synthase [Marinirhabdus sp.]